mmetsp:Transcript_8873/g.32762  ORF Transcript_8873/g.32762 Transcript_8873/m.32762 type:complete len:202 (-) Transcript_8873:789-1394(-)
MDCTWRREFCSTRQHFPPIEQGSSCRCSPGQPRKAPPCSRRAQRGRPPVLGRRRLHPRPSAQASEISERTAIHQSSSFQEWQPWVAEPCRRRTHCFGLSVHVALAFAPPQASHVDASHSPPRRPLNHCIALASHPVPPPNSSDCNNRLCSNILPFFLWLNDLHQNHYIQHEWSFISESSQGEALLDATKQQAHVRVCLAGV